MSTNKSDTHKPPQIEPIKARFLMYPYQWIGLPLLLLVPILSLLGVFDRNEKTVQAENEQLSLSVEGQTTNRYKMAGFLTVTVENEGDSTLDEVTVTINREYIEAFSEVTFSPPITSVTDDQYLITLPEMEAGQREVVNIQFQAERYGSHTALVETQVNEQGVLNTQLQTVVLP